MILLVKSEVDMKRQVGVGNEVVKFYDIHIKNDVR